MIYYIDIDETICQSPENRDYSKANKFFDEGNTVVYWTARGATSGIDWRSVTERQLEKWGVKYHELRLDKPYYDVFIDDKNINTRDWE